MQPSQQPIIFDFGGVLMDWNPYYLYRKLIPAGDPAIAAFLEEIGFVEWNLQQDAGRSFAEAVEELCARFPQHRDLIRAYDERWEESLAEPLWGTVDVLRELREAGYPLYGLSNWSWEKFSLVRPRYEFFAWFREIVISGQEKLAKPDPRLFARTLERIGAPASACLLIDDSQTNIQAAERLGFRTVHFQSPQQLRAELDQQGYRLNGRR